jgi:predicted RNase H-like HicB family nuclease
MRYNIIMAKHKVDLNTSKTYAFRVVVEPDEDRWFAYCPALHAKGAATWGYTQEEALKNIREVVEMVVEGLIEDNEPIPEREETGVKIFSGMRAAVVV